MKLAFINPSLRPESKRRQLPVGLAYIMTAVKNAGFGFDLIDMDINHLSMKDLEKSLCERTYDVYAFGCIVTGYRYVKEIASIARRANSDAIIIAGNSVADSIPEILLENTEVDIGVIGEGDITIVELLRTIEKKGDISKVSGIVYRQNGKISYTPERAVVLQIDTLGFPDWKIFDLEKYNQYGFVNANCFSTDQILSYPLNAARGCPYKCTFCYHVFMGRRYRKYSESAVMDEIKRLHYEFGCNFISFWDELTFPNIKSVEALVKKLEKLGFLVGWEATTRGDLFKKEHIGLIKDMKGVGCESISYSLENASPEILKAMNKKMDVIQFVEQTKALWDGGVTPLTSVIFGYPQETVESIKNTITVCEEGDIYPSVGFLLPLPGTPIYEWAKKNRYIDDELAYLERIGDRQDFHINLTKMGDEEFVGTVTEELKNLAKKQGLELGSLFKTVTYQKPKNIHG